MTLQELVRNKAAAWTWAMDWADQGGAGARQLREKTESEAWNALLSAEGRKDTIGLFSPLAQAVAEYMSLSGPWNEDDGEYAGEGGSYRVAP